MAESKPRWQQFPWREDNRFQLLVDGEEIFTAMLDAVKSAQSQILLEMYLVEYPKYDGTPFNYRELLERGVRFVDHFGRPNEMNQIFVGESIGTGPATYLASKRAGSGLILFAPFPSLVDVAKTRMKLYPVSLLMRYRFPSYKWAKGVDEPVFIFHGNKDSAVPYELGKRQSGNFREAKFFTVEGADHNDWHRYIGEEFDSALGNFINQTFPAN